MCWRKSLLLFLALCTGRSKCRVTHTIAPLEVVIFQRSVEQMMPTWGLNTVHYVRLQCIAMPVYMDYLVDLHLYVISLYQMSYAVWLLQYVAHFLSLPHNPLYHTSCSLLLRCGPPRYRPSAVQSTIFCCQANKWLVSEAVSVYWLLILSLSRGWRGALHSPLLCSVTGKVLTLLISFFTALCQNIQLQTLKTSAIARHLQPHTAPLIMVDSCTLFFEGGGRDDRLCEWKMIGEHNLKPQQLSLSLSVSLCISLSLSFHFDTEKILYTDWLPLNPRCDSSPNFKLPSS